MGEGKGEGRKSWMAKPPRGGAGVLRMVHHLRIPESLCACGLSALIRNHPPKAWRAKH